MTPASTQTKAPTADLLVGRYQLTRRLGTGSSAVVYLATDVRFNREVVVKLFDPEVASDPLLRARFQQQAAKAARLRHPHIANVLDAGFTDEADGPVRPFVVTEPAGLSTLRGFLDYRGRLTPLRAVRLARQIAAALSYAHRLGVVHADVKPENVLVDPSGNEALLVDFSLSFVSVRTGAITRETITRRAAYLAPEQVQGQPVGPPTDVYGLGVMLYEMVAGRPPFVAGTPQDTAERRVHERAMPAGMFEPSIPARLETVIGRALERSPEQRWPSMAELDAALGQLDAEALKPITAPTAPAKPPKNPSPAPPSRARRRGVWGTVGPVVPLVGAAVAFILGLRLLAPLLSGAALIGGPAKIVVPDFAGMSITEARAAAEARGLELTVLGDRLSDRVPKDTIVEQAPVAGWKVDPRQPVRVTVSSGVAVPDVRGMSLENARAALDRLGWKIGRVERGAYPGNPSGIVALQSPAPGDVATGPGELLLAVAE